MYWNKKHSLKVGFTLIAGLIVFMIFVTIVGSENNLFSNTYSIKFIVKDLEGLANGSMITLGGLKIGKVENIEFTNDVEETGITVTLSVKREYQRLITGTSKASIKSLGMLGDKYVDITLGNSHEKPIAENEYIMIEPSFSLEKSFRNMEKKLDHAFYDLDTVLTEFKSVSVNLNNKNSTIGRLITSSELYDNLNDVSNKLNRISADVIGQKGTLGKTIYRNDLYDNIRISTENLKSLTDGLNEGKGSLGKLLVNDSLYNDMKSVSSRLDSLLAKANGNSTVGNLLNSEEGYAELIKTVKSLNSLILDIKKNPKKYINLSIF